MTNRDMLPIAQALETTISGLYYGEHFNIWARPIRCGLSAGRCSDQLVHPQFIAVTFDSSDAAENVR